MHTSTLYGLLNLVSKFPIVLGAFGTQDSSSHHEVIVSSRTSTSTASSMSPTSWLSCPRLAAVDHACVCACVDLVCERGGGEHASLDKAQAILVHSLHCGHTTVTRIVAPSTSPTWSTTSAGPSCRPFHSNSSSGLPPPNIVLLYRSISLTSLDRDWIPIDIARLPSAEDRCSVSLSPWCSDAALPTCTGGARSFC